MSHIDEPYRHIFCCLVVGQGGLSHNLGLHVAYISVTRSGLNQLSMSNLIIAGAQWEALLQGSDRPCGGALTYCVHPSCGRSLPKVWQHLPPTSWTLHQSKGQVEILFPTHQFHYPDYYGTLWQLDVITWQRNCKPICSQDPISCFYELHGSWNLCPAT